MGRAQQMLMQAWADGFRQGEASTRQPFAGVGRCSPARRFGFGVQRRRGRAGADPMAMMTAGAQAWAQGLEAWGKMLGVDPASKAEAKDRRFAAPEWRENPVFDTIRQTYLALADKCSARSTRSKASMPTSARS